jgi:DNA-binding NarL/FixJ family response regulator
MRTDGGWLVMVLASNLIYRTGLVACLASIPDVGSVHGVATTQEALEYSTITACDVIVVDNDRLDGAEAIRALGAISDAHFIVCSSGRDEDDVVCSVAAGATAYLSKESLTAEVLEAAVAATTHGGSAIAPEFVGLLISGIVRASGEVLEPRGLSLSPLRDRDKRVLRMVADGHSTREIAAQLSYSERTVKKILHEVVMRLNARTRSQAVAQAVRRGLI